MSPFSRLRRATVAIVLCLAIASCNRAGARIHGWSAPFPTTPTDYKATSVPTLDALVLPPTDGRAAHYGQRIAGTRWTGCRTDALRPGAAPRIIGDRLVAELQASGVLRPSATASAEALAVRVDVVAFCSQAVGFMFIRVAGIVALDILIERGGTVLASKRFERVVTDADPEYTGRQVTSVEQAMRITMGDSLRELLKDVLVWMDGSIPQWKAAGANNALSGPA